jgi:hypothetical protein
VFLLIGCFVCHNIDLLINNISKICLNQWTSYEHVY